MIHMHYGLAWVLVLIVIVETRPQLNQNQALLDHDTFQHHRSRRLDVDVDVGAQGAAVNSPGVASGNLVQVPVHIPVNVCGNTVNVIGLLNPAFGNTCINARRKRLAMAKKRRMRRSPHQN